MLGVEIFRAEAYGNIQLIEMNQKIRQFEGCME